MSILNVNTIQPVGSGQTITVSAADISAPSTVVTASSFVGSNGVQVGAGKSVRIFGSASGYSDIIASSAAGASELLLPNTSGTLDRLNRAGNILQVVSANFDTTVSRASSTFADVGLSASITPSSASNKVLVMVNLCGCGKITGDTALVAHVADSSNNVLFDLEGIGGYTGGTVSNYFGSISRTFLHSPATTSSFTYKVRFASATNVSLVYINDIYTAGFDSDSTITLLEVAA